MKVVAEQKCSNITCDNLLQKLRLIKNEVTSSHSDMLLSIGWIILFIYSIALVPFKAMLIHHYYLTSILYGNFSSVIVAGAEAKIHHSTENWLVPLVLACVSGMKWLPLFYYSGFFWGKPFIHQQVKSKLAQKRLRHVETFCHNHNFLSVAICFIPFLPIPISLVLFVLGDTKTSAKTTLLYCFVCGSVVLTTFTFFGFWIGRDVIHAVTLVSTYSTYIAYIIVAMIVARIIKSRQLPRQYKQ